jgi:hypothetical protein
MPQYPSAVKSFTTRNAGDVIQPAHINDLQDEVNAIEAGLLNGSAPLNSSKSTLVTLSVTGNSTLASSITIGSQPYIFPASSGVTGQVLSVNSTSGTTMTLAWATVSGVLDRATTEQEVVNSFAETAVYTYNVPANTLSSNRALRVTMTGSYLDNAGGSHNFTTKLKLGGTTVATFVNASVGGVATRLPVELVAKVNANAATNSQRALATLEYGTGAADGSSGAVLRTAAQHAAVAEDASTILALVITVTHSLNNAGD